MSNLELLKGEERTLYMCLHGESSENLHKISDILKISYEDAIEKIKMFKKLGILIEEHENGNSYYYFRYENEIPDDAVIK
ncbi:MAG: hypothetical protein PHU12_00945 [Candidatus Aenigmarchaeota archaeon]|nr:hypothetical protein [Candidatus Aenigmarchaeota archaeon]